MILVTGGTGTIGSELVRQLQRAEVPFRVMVRDPDVARKRLGPGIELVQGDLRRPDSLAPAMAGAQRLFLLAPFAADHVAMKSAAIAAAHAAGVSHVVLSAGITSGPDSPVELGRWHGQNQQQLAATGMAWTVLQPTFFMQNFLWEAAGIRSTGGFAMPLRGARIAYIDARDIAAAAAAVLLGEGHHGRCYPLTGGEALTGPELALAFSEALGRPVRFVERSLEEEEAALVSSGLDPALARLSVEFFSLAHDGRLAVLSDAVEKLTGRPPLRFRRFLADYSDRF
jgi:uncharacterized protein YbjT (DUF2867 family)